MIDKFDIRYFFTQIHVNNIFRLHFRKLVFIGRENIPHGKPLIYTPTHRNALVDALVLVYENINKPVVFLGRADIFKKKIIVRILRFLRIMPVYRIRDGKENLSRNKEIFDACGQILKNSNPICLFPEGVYNPHQSLLPLQKATPRIALPTEAACNFELDTHIVPVSFYYTDKNRFLSDLYVTYGTPIKVSDYKELYLQNENQAINTLRHDLDARLRKYVVDIPEQDYDEYLALINVNTGGPHPEKDGIIRASKAIIDSLNHLKENNPAAYSDKISAVKEAVNILRDAGLTTRNTVGNPVRSSDLFMRYMLLTVLSPFALAGLLNTVFPILIFRKLLSMFKDKQFISSLRIVCGIFVIPLFYILQSVVIGLITGSFYCVLGYLAASPVLFYFGAYWRRWLKQNAEQCKTNRFVKHHKESWLKVMESLKIDF